MTSHHFYFLHRLRLKTVLIITMVLLLVGSLSITALAYKKPIAHAYTLATTHQPERYTELYFANNRQLPMSTPALKLHSIGFHITNHEGQDVQYYYKATMTIAGQTTVLSLGGVQLHDQQGVDTLFNFQLPKPGVQAIISVSLLQRSEHIYFRTHS